MKKSKIVVSFKYYLKMIILIYKLPIRLRLVDIEELAKNIQEMREISDKELDEYLAHLKTYIKE